MAAFLVRAAGGGGTALVAGLLVAADSRSKEVAVTMAAVVGYILAALLLFAPFYTFVRPIRKEKRVGARTAYGHIWTMFGCVAWTLYAVPNFHDNVWTVVVNGAGILLQLTYVGVFLYFALKEARRRRRHGLPMSAFFNPLYLLLGIVTFSVGLAALVVEMVMVRGVWDTKFIGVIASAVTGISYVVIMFDIVAVLRSRRATSNLDPLVEVLLNLSNASVWTFCAFLSTPVDPYSGIPCAVGAGFLLAQLGAYLFFRTDDDDFGFELRAMFQSPV